MPLVVGPVVAALGFALFALPSTGGSYWITFFPAVVVLGLGMSLSVAPLTTTVMNSVEPPYAGVASGINNAGSRVAALLAVALFGMIFTSIYNHTLDRDLERARLPPAALQAIEQQRGKLAAIEIPASLEAGDKAVIQHAIDEAFVRGFRWIMLLSALLALAR